MHEMSIAHAILEAVDGAVAGYDDPKVLHVRIAVGALAHIDDEALCFAFDTLKEETSASGAELLIERKNIDGRCRECGSRFETERLMSPCPGCGGFSIDWEGDLDTHLVSVDIDDRAIGGVESPRLLE